MTPPSEDETDAGPLKIGDLFQGYQIIKLLGRGGYASVYHARREFIGRPDDVKEIVVKAATSLGRGPDFEGGGLLDLMRALQSV